MAGLTDVASEIAGLIEKSLDFGKEMEEVLESTADDIIGDIRESAPAGKSDDHLKDSFVKLRQGKGTDMSVTVYSKTKGRIVHLVEFGFVHRSGKFVPGKPFLRPSYEKEAPGMEKRIREAIEDAAKKR